MDLRSTLNLPNADFAIPMKADLPQREPEIRKRWDEQQIYHRIKEARAGAPTFLLHDGPPYTNSPIHIGTAMNKILKDFVVKSHTMMGLRSPYVPGYDNHGLPIEQAVMKKFTEQKITPTVVELRKACREHAARFLDVQTEQFQSLGVFGLWEKPYATMNFRFEAEIIRVFKRMVEGGYIYKGLRPTLWSPTSRTALADTEIVYKEHTSKAIYVRFPLKRDPNQLFTDVPNVYTIIWTTTPWTIPANLAVAFHPELEYAVVKVGEDHYVILDALVEKVAGVLGWTDYSVLQKFDGITLDHTVFKHPIFERDSLGVVAEYVTTEDGTGVVHTAPGHGRDDFYTGVKYGLPILCPVDERGVLTEEAGEFAGTYYSKCDTVVVDRLREVGNLLHVSDYTHSYPHAERDDQPVIFRATEQWFVAIDHLDLRKRMLEQVDLVEWIPATGKHRIQAMVGGRPDWCISRQRPWGVGIPVFYGAQTREPVLDPVAIEAVAKLVEQEGSDAWFEKTPAEILPAGYTHPITGETEFVKETDVLDVWFDSGSTSLCVMEGNVEPEWKDKWPADLYLEGSDQHRGCFNSSLVIGTAIKHQAPYKQVVTHGFLVVDGGEKMSKRSGTAIDPVDVCKQYGADILRYWVASVDYTNDAPCSDALFKTFGEHYRRVRNTLRFLMSNLYDYPDGGWSGPLLDVDEWAIEQTDLLVADCVDAYRRYDFSQVVNSVHNFCGNQLSSFYLDSIKDRMYCDKADSDARRSGQLACRDILVKLNRLLAPILCYTSEEVRSKLGETSGPSVHAELFDIPSPERLAEIEGSALQTKFAAILEVRGEVFAAWEQFKLTTEAKDSQDFVLTMSTESPEVLALSLDELALYLKMSWVEISKGPAAYSFRSSEYLKCERSRLRRPDVEMVDGVPLTKRDKAVLDSMKGEAV